MTRNEGYMFSENDHAHFLDDKPLMGTSTVLNVLSKPLTWWASGMAVGELGWTNSKTTPKDERLKIAGASLEDIKKMSPEDYLAKLDKGYKAHNQRKNEAASDGKDLHAELDGFVKSRIAGRPDPVLPEKCAPFVAWANSNVEKFLASEVHVYSRELWTGGIFDVLWIGRDGKTCLGDFKSSKDAYASQFIQSGAYALQLAENGGMNAKGRVYGQPLMVDSIAVIPFGSDDPTPRIRYDVAEHMEAFRAAVKLYKLTKTYEGK